MSFAQSIIIPLSLFKSCQFDKIKVKETTKDDLPPSKKLMLKDQEMLLKSKTSNANQKTSTELNYDDILDNISNKYRPHMRAILDEIIRNKDSISIDNETYEITIKDKQISGSNIIEIFKYFTKGKVVTSDEDVPIGTQELFNFLAHDLKIPSVWIPNKSLPKKQKRYDPYRRTRSSSQRGMGWIIYILSTIKAMR